MNQFQKTQSAKILASYSTDNLEKGGKRAVLGESRVWGGKTYIKERHDWVLQREEKRKDDILSSDIPKTVYHFTTPSSLLKIWKTNELKTGKDGRVSFSEDPELWGFRGPHKDEHDEIGVKIEFESSNLPKLGAYDDSNFATDLSNEKEYISQQKIDNIKDKVKSITVSDYYKDKVKDWPKDLQEKISNNSLEEESNDHKQRNIFQAELKKHYPKADFDVKHGNTQKMALITNLDDFDDEFIDSIYKEYGKLKTVKLSDLSYWQDGIAPVGSFHTGEPLQVLSHGGKLILTDGYHRVYDLLKSGVTTTQAYIITVAELKKAGDSAYDD